MKAEPKNKLKLAAELQSLRQNRVYLAIMALLLVSVLIWIFVSVMDAGDDTEVSSEAIKYAAPINPNLDVAVFDMIEQKRFFSDSELEDFPINRLIKDRSGNYQVIPYDTPKEEIQALTTGTSPTVRTATPAPARTASAAARPASSSAVPQTP